MNYEIYNPHNKPESELPVIYGFNNGGGSGFMEAILIAESGHILGSHLCSHEGFMRGDLGIYKGTRPDRHEHFKKHYPDGYRMDFVGYSDVREHEGINRAFEANKNLPENSKEAAEGQMAKVEIEFSED